MNEADSSTPPAPSPRPGRRLGRAAAHLLRRLHALVGLFLIPWAAFYGFTAILFNHPSLWSEQPGQVLGAAEIEGTALASLPAPAELAEQVIAALRKHQAKAGGQGTALRLVHPERAGYSYDKVLVYARAGAEQYSLAMDFPGGTATVRPRPAPRAPADSAPFAVSSGLAVDSSPAEQIKRGVPEALERLGIHADQVTIPGGMPELVFQVEHDGKVWRVVYQPQRGSLTGRVADDAVGEMAARKVLTKMHVASGYPGRWNLRWGWALGIDAIGIGLLFWAMSGLVMWWQLRGLRALGMLILLSSLACAGYVGAGMYQMLDR
jgi:hypothetical protein